MTKNKTKIEIRPRVRVMAGRHIALGPGKVELLELIEQTGSITKAAQAMDMSYMRAWTLIRTMNSCFKEPLVQSNHGGKNGGGGATLTETGLIVLRGYKKMESACEQSIRTNQASVLSHLR